MAEEGNRSGNKLDFIRQIRADELKRLEIANDPFPREVMERPWTEYDRVVVLDTIFARLEAGQAMQLICSDPLMPSYATVMSWLSVDPEQEKRYDALKPARARAYFELAIWEVQRARDPEAMKVAEKRANLYLKAAALLEPAKYSDKMHTALGKSGSTAPVSITLNIGGQTQEHRGELTVIPQPESGDLP